MHLECNKDLPIYHHSVYDASQYNTYLDRSILILVSASPEVCQCS